MNGFANLDTSRTRRHASLKVGGFPGLDTLRVGRRWPLLEVGAAVPATFHLPAGWYVMGYQIGSDDAKAVQTWVETNRDHITIVDTVATDKARTVGFHIDIATDYPVKGPLLYLATQTTAADSLTTFENTNNQQTAQYVALMQAQGDTARIAAQTAFQNGKFAESTSRLAISNAKEISKLESPSIAGLFRAASNAGKTIIIGTVITLGIVLAWKAAGG